MQCPECGCDSRVMETRKNESGLHRRRECLSCKAKFQTQENIKVRKISVKVPKQLAAKAGRREGRLSVLDDWLHPDNNYLPEG